MSELTPETRTENFWVNEGDLEPITRKEQYIKHLYDETQVVPDHPLTREEYFINKAGEELHDVTVEQLSVTENGTYSEAGKAYSPVIVEVPDPVLKTKSITENGTYDASDDSADGYSSVTVDVPPTPKDDLNVTQNGEYNPTTGRAFGKVTVDVQPDLTTKSITANGTYNASADNADGYSQVSVNVPLPPNAYLLKSVANLPQAIASFSDGADAPLKELKVAIEPQQEGSGDPSPTNIRPISGWDEVNITVADDDTAPTISKVYTIDLDGTRYGGTLDVVSGELVVTNIYAIFDGSEYWSHYRSDGSTPYNAFQTNILAKFGVAILEAWGGDTINRAKCDSYICNGGTVYNHNDNAFAIDTTSVYFSTNVANTVEAFKTYINEHNIGLLATLATPLTIQLTPTAIKSLRGVNNVYANTGNIKDAEYFSKEV